MLDPSEIQRLIQEALPDAQVTIQDTNGKGDHFEARVVAAAFVGRSRLEQHQMVYAPLRALLATGELHALALKTEVPA